MKLKLKIPDGDFNGTIEKIEGALPQGATMGHSLERKRLSAVGLPDALEQEVRDAIQKVCPTVIVTIDQFEFEAE